MALTKVTGQVIKNTTDVTVGVLTVTNTLAVGGTVSIGGTLTYEDVTNVDAVGLITARNGIVVGSGITLSKDGDGFFTGVTTATTFVGALTGNVTGNISGGTVAGSTGTFTGDVDIADKIVHTGDTNTAIRFPAADTFTVETGGSERARIDSSGDFGIGMSPSGVRLDVYSSSAADIARFSGPNSAGLTIRNDTANELQLHTAPSDALIFGTNGENERVRIDSSGRLLVGTTTEGNGDADEFTIANVGGGNMGMTIRSGTGALGNIFFSDGTSGDSEYRGMIQYGHNNDSMRFSTSATERVRIDSSGRLGLGTNNPDTLLHLNTSSGSTLQRFQSSSYSSYIAQVQADDNVSNGSVAGDLHLRGQSGVSMSANNGTATHFRIASDGDVTISPSGDPRLILTGSGHPQLTLTTTSGTDHCGINFGDSDDINAGMIQYTNSSDYMVFHTGGTERMRIHNSLYTSFGTTSATPTNGGVAIEGQVGHIQLSRANTNGEVMIRFMRDSAQRGSISVSTSTTYNTTSDYRLKENITNLIDAITRIKKITPRRFNFIEDENKQIIDGFIAHEVSEAVPESVTGEKDEVYLEDCSQSGKKKGDPKYQEVDYSKHVPLLTAALQEAITKIETLETKVAALEG